MNIASSLKALGPEHQALRRPVQPGQINKQNTAFDMEGRSRETEQSTATPSTILTAPEKESLHMLFGTEKPETMQFYNNETTPMTPKGHFIDLIG